MCDLLTVESKRNMEWGWYTLLNDYVNWKDFELTYILPEHNLKYKTLSDTNDVSLKTKKK